jgi:hypothetical protein
MTLSPNAELGKFERLAGNATPHRRALLDCAGVFARALGMGVRLNASAAAISLNVKAEAKKDRL